MAQCIKCKATIPDGTQYCDNCKQEMKSKADESYLDSLLSSIAPTEPQPRLYKTKNNQVEIPKDYNIFDHNDDSDMDFLNRLFDNTEQEEMTTKPAETEPTSEKTMEEEPIVNAVTNEESPTAQQDTRDLTDNDQDILDLINEINNSEELPPVEDIADYHLENKEEDAFTNQFKAEEDLEHPSAQTTGVGDVFSDSLSAISSLNDAQIDEDLLKMIPDIHDHSENIADKKEKRARKSGFFARVFGNIKEELSEEELEKRKQEAIQKGEKVQQDKEEKLKEKKAKKEQKKQEKAVKAQQAKEDATKRKQKKEAQAKAKKEEKERKSKEIQQLIDEIDENEGKINKIGATIVFTFFAAAAVVIVVGTNLYNYAISIKNATTNFNIQRYNEAYNNVYGVDIKEEDFEIYDKIMTVMYVNKQLNSYNNYCLMSKYPEALDSLLKGLERYDKYYMLASMLNITNDLDYVKEQIVTELNRTFSMTEEEARVMLLLDDQAEYSNAVYAMAQERTANLQQQKNE